MIFKPIMLKSSVTFGLIMLIFLKTCRKLRHNNTMTPITSCLVFDNATIPCQKAREVMQFFGTDDAYAFGHSQTNS